MQHTANWTDLYGAVHACFEGRSGGHRWLVALPAAAGDDALDAALNALKRLDGKGRVDLLVFSDPAAVPAAAHELGARGVLLLHGEPDPQGQGPQDQQWQALPLRRSPADTAQAALESWMDEVPHGR
ncbi:MAG: hypothetical protein Q4C67_03440 [Deinococcus sp.]|nr:hypothetical protein [Deinococcus sp.]